MNLFAVWLLIGVVLVAVRLGFALIKARAYRMAAWEWLLLVAASIMLWPYCLWLWTKYLGEE